MLAPISLYPCYRVGKRRSVRLLLLLPLVMVGLAEEPFEEEMARRAVEDCRGAKI